MPPVPRRHTSNILSFPYLFISVLSHWFLALTGVIIVILIIRFFNNSLFGELCPCKNTFDSPHFSLSSCFSAQTGVKTIFDDPFFLSLLFLADSGINAGSWQCLHHHYRVLCREAVEVLSHSDFFQSHAFYINLWRPRFRRGLQEKPLIFLSRVLIIQ